VMNSRRPMRNVISSLQPEEPRKNSTPIGPVYGTALPGRGRRWCGQPLPGHRQKPPSLASVDPWPVAHDWWNGRWRPVFGWKAEQRSHPNGL